MAKQSRQRRTRPTPRREVSGRRPAAQGRKNRSTRATPRQAGGLHDLTHYSRNLKSGFSRLVNGMDPAAWISVLLGASLGMVIVALSAKLVLAFGGTDGCHRALIAGSLLCLAVGLGAPQNVASWIYTLAWRRFVRRDRHSGLAADFFNRGPADRPLHFVVLSVISLGAGILTALLPAAASLSVLGHGYLRGHFLWPAPALSTLHVLLSFLAGLLPLGAIGLAVVCTHHLSRRQSHWDIRITGWLMIGSAVGAAAGGLLAITRAKPDLALVAAALPSLTASLVGAVWGKPDQKAASHTDHGSSPELPTWSDRWPRALRASTVGVGLCGVAALAVWTSQSRVAFSRSGAFVPFLLLVWGIGFLLGSRRKKTNPGSIGGYGVCCAVAGILTAAGVFAAAGGWSEGRVFPAVLLAGAGLAATGFAAALGHQVLLSRVADRSSVAVAILTRIIVLSALLVWVGIPAAFGTLGEAASLTAVALTLLALGGSLVIHEPTCSVRTRGARLCGVFGAVGAMIALAPTLSGTTANSQSQDPMARHERANPTAQPSVRSASVSPRTGAGDASTDR